MFRKENGLSILSVELVVAVLSYLTYRDLLKCRQLCREVHDIIEHTSALRYKIELGLTGNQDGNSSKSVPDRLKELRRTQRDWQSPKPTLISSASVPSRDWSHAKWQKDVFFGRCPEDDRRLDVFNFSNAFAGDDSERLQQLQFDVPFDVYSVDFGQDLVAMARCSVANTET
ncbi:hypothetical protein BDW22DRAFT_568433 [Trametopsis cervina]|nr:hypothetical protein BDW22DRAFT_568433 [Trametopsis cervina]